MDTILQFLTGVLRYVLPVLALLILALFIGLGILFDIIGVRDLSVSQPPPGAQDGPAGGPK